MNDALQIAAAPATYVPGTTAASSARSTAGGTDGASFAGLLAQAGVAQQLAVAPPSNASQPAEGASQGTGIHSTGQSTQQGSGTVVSPALAEIATAPAPGQSATTAELQVSMATVATVAPQRAITEAPSAAPLSPANLTATAEPQPVAALAAKVPQAAATASTLGGKAPASLTRATGGASTTAGSGKRKSIPDAADAAAPTTAPFTPTLSGTPLPLADAAPTLSGTPLPLANVATTMSGTPLPLTNVATTMSGTPLPPTKAAATTSGTPLPLTNAATTTVSVVQSFVPLTVSTPLAVPPASSAAPPVSPVEQAVAPASPRTTAALSPAVQADVENASDGQTTPTATVALPATLAATIPQQISGSATRPPRSMHGGSRALEDAKDSTPGAASLQVGKGAGSAATDGVPTGSFEGATTTAVPLSAAQITAASPIPLPAPAVSSAAAPSAALEVSSVAPPAATAADAPNAKASDFNAQVAGKQGTHGGGARKSAADTSDTPDAAAQPAFASTVPAAHAAVALTHASTAVAAAASAAGATPVDRGVSFVAGHMATTGQAHTLGAAAAATLDSGLDASPASTPARAGALEVGFHDTTLGWLSVRASVDPSGDLHAALATHNPAAASAVSSLLPSLGRFLQDQNVVVQSVSSSAQMASGVAKDAAAQAGGAGSSGLGQGTPQPQSQSQGQAQYGAGQGGGSTSNRQGSARDAQTSTTWAVAGDRRGSTSSLDARAGVSTPFAAADRTSTVSVRI